MRQNPNRTARIEASIAPEVLETVRRAAEIEGCSVSDFVVAAAHAAAQKAIEATQIVRLSLVDQRPFAEALASPPAPWDALRRAAAAWGELVEEP